MGIITFHLSDMLEGDKYHWEIPMPPLCSWGVIGYRCQFKCDSLIGMFKQRAAPPKPTHIQVGSPYDFYWRCTHCNIWVIKRIYHSKTCPCCNGQMKGKSRHWKKLWNKPVIKYIE
jgi:hypothetical protein